MGQAAPGDCLDRYAIRPGSSALLSAVRSLTATVPLTGTLVFEMLTLPPTGTLVFEIATFAVPRAATGTGCADVFTAST